MRKTRELEHWVEEIDEQMTAGLEALRLEVKTLKARIQELEEKPPQQTGWIPQQQLRQQQPLVIAPLK